MGLKQGFFRLGLAILGLLFSILSVQAEINEGFMRRLILYKSDCKLDTLSHEVVTEGKVNFFATCENLSFYPDGVNIHCSSDTDETSCKIMTESRTFKELDILHRDRN